MWNVERFTSWSVLRRFRIYGLGAQELSSEVHLCAKGLALGSQGLSLNERVSLEPRFYRSPSHTNQNGEQNEPQAH